MLRLTWTETALEDLRWWSDQDPRKLRKIIQLCLAACTEPEKGIGKPEALRFAYQGYWSRRIDHEHGLVYAFDHDAITVIQCRYHYVKK